MYQAGSKKGLVHIKTLGPGEHFGELALINGERRGLYYRVKSEECQLLKVDRDTFTRILGSIEDHLKKDDSHEFDKKIFLVAQRKKLNS